MDPTVVTNLVNDPPRDLVNLINDTRTSDEARSAIAEIAKPGTALSENGINKTGDGRLQIVNEQQEFS